MEELSRMLSALSSVARISIFPTTEITCTLFPITAFVCLVAVLNVSTAQLVAAPYPLSCIVAERFSFETDFAEIFPQAFNTALSPIPISVIWSITVLPALEVPNAANPAFRRSARVSAKIRLSASTTMSFADSAYPLI